MNCRLIISIIFAGLCLRIGAQETPKEAPETVNAYDKAQWAYWEEKLMIQWEYRKRISEIILKADRIEVFLLDFSLPEVESEGVTGIETFPITPYGKDTRIVKKVELQPGDLKVFSEAVASALTAKAGEGGVLCHYPIHGIKVFRAGHQIFQTSLCWKCGNYYVEFPDTASWQQMSGSFVQLKELLEKHLPIPPEEVKRFEQMMGKASKGGQKPAGKAKE